MAPSDKFDTEISGGNFAAPVNTGVNYGSMDSHAEFDMAGADTTAALLDLLARLRAELENTAITQPTRDAAMTMVGELTGGVDPAQPGDAEPGRLHGLFNALKHLVRPLNVSADLISGIGRLLGVLHGGP